ALTKQPDARIDLLRRLAEHSAGRAGDDAQAEACWQEILTLMPTDTSVRDQLIALYRRRGDYAALDRALTRQAGRAIDAGAALEYWRAAAANVEEQLNDPARAVRAWLRVLDLAPDDAAASARLIAHVRAAATPRVLCAALEDDLALTTDPAARAE